MLPDDDDGGGPRNVDSIQTVDAADSPRRRHPNNGDACCVCVFLLDNNMYIL
jgi:hypothetical protein